MPRTIKRSDHLIWSGVAEAVSAKLIPEPKPKPRPDPEPEPKPPEPII